MGDRKIKGQLRIPTRIYIKSSLQTENCQIKNKSSKVVFCLLISYCLIYWPILFMHFFKPKRTLPIKCMGILVEAMQSIFLPQHAISSF